MSEKSQLALCGESSFPPEELDDEETFYDVMTKSILHSSQLDIIDSMETDDFKYTYKELINDIKQVPFRNQRRFLENVLTKISEIYDFEFPIKIDINNLNDVSELYQFLEFIEFDNVSFISRVWKYLGKDLRNLDIEKFCISNSIKIIKEVEDQLQSYDFNEKITLFLRTYYKDKFIKWFVRQTENSKIEIMIEQI
jgi:hypothetical protein